MILDLNRKLFIALKCDSNPRKWSGQLKRLLHQAGSQCIQTFSHTTPWNTTYFVIVFFYSILFTYYKTTKDYGSVFFKEFHFIVLRGLKMHWSCPFHDYQSKLCALMAPQSSYFSLVLTLLFCQYITYILYFWSKIHFRVKCTP